MSGMLLCLKFAAGVSGIIYKKKAQCFVANAYGIGGQTVDNRNLLAISIKHSKYRWKFGMPCWLWGHRTKDDERRCFGGYTQYPHHAEVYSLKEWQESGYGDICKADAPVHMEIEFCKKWKKYDSVLVPIDEYIDYCKCACLPLDKPKEG